MNGTTRHGGIVQVWMDDGHVYVGAAMEGGPRKRYQSIPLSPTEARNMANWLRGAADDAEREHDCSACAKEAEVKR